MLIVPLEEARAGMKLAMTVTHPEQPEQDLLKPGFELRDDVIARLVQIGVETIYVDYPDLGDLDKQMAAYLSPARAQIYKQIRDTISAVQKTARPTVSFTDYYSATRDLVLTLMQQGDNAVYLDQMSGKLGANAVAHATAVAHLSLMLGLKLQSYLVNQRARLTPAHAREVVNLGVAGMLHDIGVASLSPEARKLTRVAELKDGDETLLAEWQTHPQRGYDLVKGGIEPSAAAAVLHHHQHFDGSGFPLPSVRSDEEPRNYGQRIHIFARVVAVADLYDRLTVGGEGLRRQNVEILHLMRTRYAGWIDPEIMRIVPALIPPFPPGMKVTLNDGTQAVTVGMKADRPYRPMVRRIERAEPFELAAEVLDLSARGDLQVESVGGLKVDGMVPGVIAAGQALVAAL